MTLLATAALLYLAQASQESVLQFNIEALQNQSVQLAGKNADLHATATDLQSTPRIDQAATTRFHMTRQDLSTAIWVWPVLPRVRTPRALDADTVAAAGRSQPLSWMEHALTVVRESL
jgi:hypothetical protein